MAARCFLSLGSDEGDRLARLRDALEALSRLPRTRLARASSVLETAPARARGQRRAGRGPAYLNCVAAVETGLSPLGLLIELKRLEALAGRKPGRRGASRPLDIDLLFYGRRSLSSRLLTVPHPLALRRRFVLSGLAELAPGWRPAGGGGRTSRELLDGLKAPSQNVSVYSKASRRRPA